MYENDRFAYPDNVFIKGIYAAGSGDAIAMTLGYLKKHWKLPAWNKAEISDMRGRTVATIERNKHVG